MPSTHNSSQRFQHHHAFFKLVSSLQASLPKPSVCLDLALATLVLVAMKTLLPVDKRLQSQQSRNPVLTAGQPFD